MSYFQQVRRSTIASTTAEHLIRLGETLEALEIALPDTIIEASENGQASLHKLKEYRAEANPQAFASEVEAKLANGTATIAELMAAASAKELTITDPNTAFSRMLTNAAHLVSKKMHAEYAAHGDAWVTETLRPTVDKHVATILNAAPEMLTVDPRDDPKQLDTLNYIPAVMDAWGALDSIYAVFHQLRSLGVVTSSLQRNDCYQFDGNPGARDAMQANNITWFIWAAHNGHKPGIYTEADNEHNWK